MADGMQKDWRELCVAVTNERDSTKLTSLVQELIEALDKGERSWRHTPIPHLTQSQRISTPLECDFLRTDPGTSLYAVVARESLYRWHKLLGYAQAAFHPDSTGYSTYTTKAG